MLWRPLFSGRVSSPKFIRREPSAPPLGDVLSQEPASWKPMRTAARALSLQRPSEPLKCFVSSAETSHPGFC